MNLALAVKGKCIPDVLTSLPKSSQGEINEAIWLCCEIDSSDCMDTLIQNKVNISILNAMGNDPLIHAALHDSRKCLQVLLNQSMKNTVDPKTINNDRWTALLACYNGNPDGVESLIKKGADVNASDSGGYSPLLRAAEANSIDCLTTILNPFYKAKINHQNKKGWTALHFVANNKSVSCMRLLLDQKTPIDVNKPDSEGETALMKGDDPPSLSHCSW
jgi:ankyrin repeat protein